MINFKIKTIKLNLINYMIVCFMTLSFSANAQEDSMHINFNPYLLADLKMEFEECNELAKLTKSNNKLDTRDCDIEYDLYKIYMYEIYNNKDIYIRLFEKEINSLKSIDTTYVIFKYYLPICSTLTKNPILTKEEYLIYIVNALKKENFFEAWKYILDY